MNRILSTLLITAICAPGVIGQRDPFSVATLDSGDRYLISTGTMVSASASRSGRNTRTLGSRGRELMGDVSEALSIIEENHVDGSSGNERKHVERAIEGMLSSLDPHSEFLDRTEFDDLLEEQRAEFSGIGATIVTYQVDGRNQTYVFDTVEESPARIAGLRFGDRIVDVDGRSTGGLSTDEVRALVRGKTGSAVTLRVDRISGERLAVRLRRMTVRQRSVPTSYMLRPGIGYVDATEGFTETTDAEIRRAVARLKREGMRSLILDLRNNPGGLLNQAVRVSELFLPYGRVILTQRGRGVEDNRQWLSRNSLPETLPLVVLVNSSTASAAEIVAGALQDHDRAVIVGETTFGKGLVQTVIGLEDGAGLALTTGRYFTPSGRSVQRSYKDLGTYSYLNRRPLAASRSDLDVSKTDNGRVVLGGNGVMPEIALSDRLSQMVSANPTKRSFFRAIEILRNHSKGGRENHQLLGSGTIWHLTRLSDIRPTRGNTDCIPAGYIESSGEELELRHLIATADQGSVTSRQVVVEADPLVLRAVDELRKHSPSRRLALRGK